MALYHKKESIYRPGTEFHYDTVPQEGEYLL